MQLSEHFSDAELGVAGADARLVDNAQALCEQVLEPLRAHWGAVRVHDSYRDSGHNARVGGKADSYHLYEGGRCAADFDVPGYGCAVIFDWLRLQSGLPFDKAILESAADGEPVCVHVQYDRCAAPRREAYTGSTGAGAAYLRVEVR